MRRKLKTHAELCFIHLDSLSFIFIFPISIVKVLTKCTCVWYESLPFFFVLKFAQVPKPFFFFFFFSGFHTLSFGGIFFFQISKKEELPHFDLDFSLGGFFLILFFSLFGQVLINFVTIQYSWGVHNLMQHQKNWWKRKRKKIINMLSLGQSPPLWALSE